MRACPECGLSIDDEATFCATCGWRSPESAREPGSAPAAAAAVRGSSRPGGRADIWASVWSAPRLLWAIPLVAILLAGHVAFPHLPWSRYAVRFDDTWQTDPLRVAAGLCVLLAGVGLFLVLARLSARGR